MKSSKKNKTPIATTIEDYKDSSSFYEEMALLKAQELIATLMESSQVNKTELASRLKQSKAHITELLSDGRNMTLKTFGRVCFHLGAELDFVSSEIGGCQFAQPQTYNMSVSSITSFSNALACDECDYEPLAA